MRIEQIVEEYLDYRSYVSHTLWQHRLFLGLSSADGARVRLSDAAVWPLVLNEAKQLARLSKRLFGIVSKPLNAVWATLPAIEQRLKLAEKDLRQGKDEAFASFRTEAEVFSQKLSLAGTVLQEHTPDFSEKAVTRYLANVSFAQFTEQTGKFLKLQMAPRLKILGKDGSQASATYREFWAISSEAYLLTRTAIVAAAVEELGAEDTKIVRVLQLMIRSVEQVVSCWSPVVAEEKFPDLLDERLRAEGYASLEALVAQIRAMESLNATHPGN